jgi:CheY-like chemotaxis protein/HPt (histidine-containing phosphotransfer) domain-containing protein
VNDLVVSDDEIPKLCSVRRTGLPASTNLSGVGADSDGLMDEGRHPLVLIVEDNSVNQVLAVAQLDQLGCRSVVAPTGWRALEEIEKQQFDLILMDWQLGDIDGLETTRRIRDREASRNARRTPVVAVTANAMSGDRQQCIDAGMDDFLSKPVGLADLRAAIERALFSDDPPGEDPLRTSARELEMEPEAIGRLIDEVGDVSVVAQIMSTFLEELPSRMQEVIDAMALGDFDRARRVAHTIKSTSELLGETELAATARRIETSTTEDGVFLSDLTAELRTTVSEAHQRVAAARDALASR